MLSDTQVLSSSIYTSLLPCAWSSLSPLGFSYIQLILGLYLLAFFFSFLISSFHSYKLSVHRGKKILKVSDHYCIKHFLYFFCLSSSQHYAADQLNENAAQLNSLLFLKAKVGAELNP